jgi:thioredoxin-related protein
MWKKSPLLPIFRDFFCCAAFFGVLLAAGIAQASADKFFDLSLGDFKAELATASQAGKQGILLMFETEDCPYCRRMREQVLSRGDVQAYFHRQFSIYSVDIRGDVSVTDFSGTETNEKTLARAMRVRGTPTFVFVGLDGKELARYTGATKDAKEFMQLGRYVAEGHYRNQSFEQFYPEARTERKKP